jgi:hypothetical protein
LAKFGQHRSDEGGKHGTLILTGVSPRLNSVDG